jgi:flagellin-specific chaperone FliS
MKYLLFISYNNGLKHNAVYENIPILYESILQLLEEENLKNENEKIPSVSE